MWIVASNNVAFRMNGALDCIAKYECFHLIEQRQTGAKL